MADDLQEKFDSDRKLWGGAQELEFFLTTCGLRLKEKKRREGYKFYQEQKRKVESMEKKAKIEVKIGNGIGLAGERGNGRLKNG